MPNWLWVKPKRLSDNAELAVNSHGCNDGVCEIKPFLYILYIHYTVILIVGGVILNNSFNIGLVKGDKRM